MSFLGSEFLQLLIDTSEKASSVTGDEDRVRHFLRGLALSVPLCVAPPGIRSPSPVGAYCSSASVPATD